MGFTVLCWWLSFPIEEKWLEGHRVSSSNIKFVDLNVASSMFFAKIFSGSFVSQVSPSCILLGKFRALRTEFDIMRLLNSELTLRSQGVFSSQQVWDGVTCTYKDGAWTPFDLSKLLDLDLGLFPTEISTSSSSNDEES
ncbi:hypothetical protein RIF29_24838 [Crotalaria pallida]|uniref:Uncharacterized protein n=1 Tax=Crotalaria pallida TaxID=3830 RepID=A0AAN9HYS6_CROPI